MNHYPPNISFKFDWRKYQKRVLDELNSHLDDDHLHIIAPPGSGKTVLGLEVAIRLDKPTLILTPTIAIRNQWIQRFCDLFLQTDHKPEWISREIKHPKFLTVATYQALHAACTGEAEVEEDTEVDEEENKKNDEVNKSLAAESIDIIEVLKSQNVGTIVVDEAHHLKNSWWESLTLVKTAINPTIVGLTATPPYDVSYTEWQRYVELNGPIDAEITVPELVVEGDLCPHQDYVFFSRPTIEEEQKIDNFRNRIKDLFNTILNDEILLSALEKHPVYQSPKDHLEWIYSNLEYYSATLIFLSAAGKEVSKNHINIIGNKNFKIPELTYEWIETLLTFYLYKDAIGFAGYSEHQENLINKLKRNGAIERRTINFRENKKINTTLSSSISKLKSIDEIVSFEYKQLRQDLRMVILTDYIRKEYLVSQSKNELELNKIGVMPIFEQLRRTNRHKVKIGVLTGSLIIIPSEALGVFQTIASDYGIERINSSSLPFDKNYLVIGSTEQLKHDVVHIVTKVFQQGHIEVLIGTKSLLGEGWDAPSINALILASFVGSYVLSNQMRGRAIRTQHKNDLKTANIWHLACVDPTSKDGGDDLQLLRRRFKSFVGVSFRDNVNIENGIERLHLPNHLDSQQNVGVVNEHMLSSAGKRKELKQKWLEALQRGTRLVEEIKIPFPEDEDYKGIKSMYYSKTIKYLMAMLSSLVFPFLLEVLQLFTKVARHINSIDDLKIWLAIIGVFSAVIFGKLSFNTFRLYIKYRDISKNIKQIGDALLISLIHTKAIHSDRLSLNVDANVNDYGTIYCHLEGGTTFEKSTFITCLHEVIGLVENPKYVIIRKSRFLEIFSQKDYHSVPELIGKRKQYAEFFKDQWKENVGRCELIYTRTVEGRKILLKSRMRSLASQFEDKTERVNIWK